MEQDLRKDSTRSEAAKRTWEERKRKERRHQIQQVLIGSSVVFLICLTFVVGGLTLTHKLQQIEVKYLEMNHQFEGMKFVATELLTYQTIENYLFDNQADMDHREIRDITRVIYHYHQRYGTNGYLNPIGLDYDMILALLEYESGFRKSALSRAGAMGIMQLMPYMFRRQVKNHFKITDLSAEELRQLAFNPRVNLICGLELLIEYQLEFIADGHASPTDWKIAMSRYNWSMTAVADMMTASTKGEPKASLKYAVDIEKKRKKYQKLLAVDGSLDVKESTSNTKIN